jgi:hypothetical protein
MAYSDDLLEQARALATAEQYRPKQASVRRAVSAAYYALFHEVVERVAVSVLVGIDAAGPVGARIRRVVEHGAALKAAKWFSGTGKMPERISVMRGSVAGAVEPALAQFCRTFEDLQEERHRAHYDLSAPFARADANRRIQEAVSAIAALRGLEAKGDTLIFLLGCLLGESLNRKRADT